MSLLDLLHPPQRVVSLVPSMTESLYALGFGDTLVAVTDYCIHPPQALQSHPAIGGPKTPRLDEIIALQPDFVIANQEENTPQTVQTLQEAGIPVWVSFPKTVDQAIEDLNKLAGFFRSKTASLSVETLERMVELLQSTIPEQGLRYFCPIWYANSDEGNPWWMTFNHDTYSHDLLRILGGENVFADRTRRYPLEADLGHADPEDPANRDTRYPRVTLQEITAAAPDLILLPNEPFNFEIEHHREFMQLFADTPAVKNQRLFLLDGSLITWHGTRLAPALQTLPQFFQ